MATEINMYDSCVTFLHCTYGINALEAIYMFSLSSLCQLLPEALCAFRLVLDKQLVLNHADRISKMALQRCTDGFDETSDTNVWQTLVSSRIQH